MTNLMFLLLYTIPARRTFKCWVRWYELQGHAKPCLTSRKYGPWAFDATWLTDPVEVVAEEKEQP